MVWLARGIFAAPPAPIELVQFLAALCVPPALIGILWLLGMRTRRAAARRFGHSAPAMRAEAASLERTMAILARQDRPSLVSGTRGSGRVNLGGRRSPQTKQT